MRARVEKVDVLGWNKSKSIDGSKVLEVGKMQARNTETLHRIYENLLKAKRKKRGAKLNSSIIVLITVMENYKFDKNNGNKKEVIPLLDDFECFKIS